MPTGLITISQYITNPAVQLSGDDDLEVRGWYTNSFIAGDGVTPVTGNFTNGQQGPYYSITPTLNGSGYLVVPAHEIQATTLSNPTANYIEQLWVNGSLVQDLMPNNQVANGWQIPTVYGDPIAFDEIATYNRARRLLYPPNTYFTADETIREIQRIAGLQAYAGLNILGRTELDTAPDITSKPIAVGVNSPVIPSFVINARAYASFNLAVAAVDLLGGGTVLVTDLSNVTANISVPSYIRVRFDGQGIIEATSPPKTVTFLGPVEAPAIQVFAATVTISFEGNYRVQTILPEWFGAGPEMAASVNTPALQAAIVAAFGDGDRTNGSGLWVYNRILHFSGIYNINDELQCYSMIGFLWTGENKFNSGLRQTATNKRIIDGQSVAYGLFFNLIFTTNASQNVPLIDIDWNGSDTPDDLKTQQVTFDEFVLAGNNVGYIGIQNAKSGGAAQGDNVYLTHFTISGFTQAGYQIGGGADGSPTALAFNAILNTIGPGDIQGCPQYGIACYGGSYVFDGVVSFENQALNNVGFPTQTGADNLIWGPQNVSDLRNSRSESLRYIQSNGAVNLTNITMSPYGAAWWSEAGSTLSNTVAYEDELVTGTMTGGDGKLYKVIAAPVGPTEPSHAITTPFSTSVITDSTGAYVVNAWVGHWMRVTYPNCFEVFAVVASNTATTFTLVDPIPFLPGDVFPAQACGLTTNYELFTNAGDPFPRWTGLPITTATGGSLTTIVVAGAGWGINDFIGFRASIVSGAGKYQYGIVTGNTADTITVAAGWVTDYELEVLPAYGIAAPTAGSTFVVEPNWGTQTTDGVIEWELFDFSVVDGIASAFAGQINGFSGSQGGKFKLGTAAGSSTSYQNIVPTRSDWATGSGNGFDNVISPSPFHNIIIKRIVNGNDIGIPWTYPRNSGSQVLGPGITQRTQGTEWIMWEAGETGGGPNYPDVGLGRGDDQFGNTTANKDILAIQGKLGKKTARGANQAGTALQLQGQLSTGTGVGGPVEFLAAAAGGAGSNPNSAIVRGRIDASTTANDTALLLWDVTAGTLRRVTIGANDSGGAGFRVLRIPN